ncbi:MAG: hypothetical protein ABI035_12125 [Gemmatimonadaceae bacterium]
MMKSVCIAVVAAFFAVAPLSAQVVRRATAGDSLLIRDNVYRELFAGITVSPAQKTRAQEVIAISQRQEMKVGPFHNCEERQVLVDVIARRDSTLLAMMTNAADSAKFAKHAESFVMGPCPFAKE